MPEKGSIRVSVAGATDVGQVRDHNEDNLLVTDLTAGERLGSGDTLSRELGPKGLLAAVADGMGGAASGELASEMAVDSIHEASIARGIEAESSDIESVAVALSDCVTEANTRIYEKSQAESEHRGMGTTMTAVWAMGNQIAIGQVGDSRAYLLRKGKLVQVTKDQSLISQLIEDGTLTEEEAERLGGRNIILQALGVEEGVDVETKTMEVLDGDLLLLCSDGLTGMVKDAEIEATLTSTADLGAACAQLIRQGNEGGGRDNITVILARFEGEGLRAPMQPLSAEEGKPAAATFAAPEVPEAKTPRTKPAVCALAALVVAVIAFFLLTGGSAGDVTFRFPGTGASGTLARLEEKGGKVADEPAITLSPASGADTVLLEDVPSGFYHLTARHPDYEDLSITYEISGDAEVDLEMVPLPGTLTLVPVQDRVTVTIVHKPVREGDDPWTSDHPLDSAKPREIPQVPAGELEITVARSSFASKTVSAVLPPNGEAELTLPRLDEITGRLDVSGGVPGMKVEIRDDWGEVIWSVDLPESGEVTAKVRVGEHSLMATHEKYRTWEADVTITEGESVSVRIAAGGKPGALAIVGQEGDRITVLAPDGTEWKRDEIPAGGKLLFERVPPGKYQVRLERQGQPVSAKPVTVEAAVEAVVEFAK